MEVSRTSLPFKVLVLLFSISFAGVCSGHSAAFPDSFVFDDSNEGRNADNSTTARSALSAINCFDGLAGEYPCRNIDLLASMTPEQLGGGSASLNDIWGWTDLLNNREIAIVGRTTGTSFVDVTDAEQPVLLGFLPSHNGGDESWRDVKVYQDHAFIVADGLSNSSHGLQIYNLNNLASVTPGSTLTETAHLAGFGPVHNIAINENSGYAYIVGANQCSGGLYMVNVSSPASPSFAGCYSSDGYTHDAQCVIYQGPDTRYTAHEICIAYNEDTLTIVDVDNKSNPLLLSRTSYQNAQYTHQGWFLDDTHTYIILNDELDESNTSINTTSHIFNLALLTAPQRTGSHVASTKAIDHNLYVKDSFVYPSNYRAGLRILATDNITTGSLQERAYFDTIPCSDSAQISGAWSNYIYFASGTVLISDIAGGLLIVRPDMTAIANNANNGPPSTSSACVVASGGGGGGSLSVYTLLLLALMLLIPVIRQMPSKK